MSSNLSDLGMEIVNHPILKVRLQFHAGKWYVEYQRKPKYFFDKWWWFDDSTFSEYNDAFVRAQTLAAQGAVKELQHKKPTVFLT